MVEKFTGQHFERAGGDDNSMSLRKMMIQLAYRILQNQWLPLSNDLSDMFFGQCTDSIVGPPQSCRPHSEFNRQVARVFASAKAGRAMGLKL